MSQATLDADAFRFHELRHTCASIMDSTVVEPKYAQDRLGHADISVTLNTYTHVLPDKRADVAKKIEEAIVLPVGIRLASKAPDTHPALSLLHMY